MGRKGTAQALNGLPVGTVTWFALHRTFFLICEAEYLVASKAEGDGGSQGGGAARLTNAIETSIEFSVGAAGQDG